MDLAKLDSSAAAERGAELQLKSPIDGLVLKDEETGEPVTLTLLGTDSKVFQKITHAKTDERIKRLRGQKLKVTANELEVDALDLLTALTIGWKHVIIDGKKVEFTPGAAKMLYQRFAWIREQADEFVNDRANFLGN